jgi:predicted transcriptional regulator
MTESINPTDDYTLVSQEETPSECDAPFSESHRALLRDRISRDGRSLAEIASLARMSRRQLGRIIAGQKPLRLVDLSRLSDILGIDAARAVIAIEVIGDWSAYEDPVLGILIGMLAPVFRKVDASADFPIEPLTTAAEEEFTTWLANTLVTNQAQIRRRRDKFLNPPTL